MTNVFIAPKLRVGFRERTDCFTGKLAYVIYYDDKGKIRKEKSWESWRDNKIDPMEFDNAPMDGFTLNKDIKRYNGEWFSSNRTMIRVHDPRGFEFEVTTENLIAILMHTDCLRRGLVGQFVYAWIGTELILLPTNSEEYQVASKYTAGLSKKVSVKTLIPGVSYKTKKQGDTIFLGKFNWYEYANKKDSKNARGLRQESKVMVFTNDEGKTFCKKSSADFLSEANSDTPVSNFAELVEMFNKKQYANKIVKFEFRRTTFDPTLKDQKWSTYPYLNRTQYFMETSTPGVFCSFSVSAESSYKINEYILNGYNCSVGSQYYTHSQNGYQGMNQLNGELIEVPSNFRRDCYNSYYNKPSLTALEQVQAYKLYDLYLTYENGTEREIKSFYELDAD